MAATDNSVDFEFSEIHSGLRNFQDFKDTVMHRDMQQFWKEQIEITKSELLKAKTMEDVARLQGLAEGQYQGLLLVDAFINYLKEE
jgi:hypothetical protein